MEDGSSYAYFFILVINDVSTSFRGLSLTGRVFFFTGVGSSKGLLFFFAFSSLMAFNDGKTRVRPEEEGARRLRAKSASFIPWSDVPDKYS